MAEPSRKRIAAAVLDNYGRTFAGELGIPLERATPSPLFRWLCASILFSARIGTSIAANAARALAEAGWTTAQKMADSTWAERTRVLNRSGYARYDESTSRMLGEDAELLVSQYGGDLGRLREAARQDPEEERTRLKEFKGMGDVGVDIFLREVQQVWKEVYPFVDKKSLKCARKLHIAANADELAALVPHRDFPRLIAGLVRVDLAAAHDKVVEAAHGSGKTTELSRELRA